jgi:hypothetical protein
MVHRHKVRQQSTVAYSCDILMYQYIGTSQKAASNNTFKLTTLDAIT